ncbi:MAG: M28 family peptidase, partial [Candidatus Latescibacteria bacterium]|nr:M28 family peptidase [Candidatus Latescibacterota bacterium]
MRVFVYLILCLMCVVAAEGAVDDDVLALVQQIKSETIDADVQRIVAFETRFMGSDSNAAASVWLGERLASFGYPVHFDTFEVNAPRRTYFTGHSFEVRGLKQWNVIATKRGSLFPHKKVVLGAHYDSISLDRAQSEQDVAPGGDDNASGMSALLE